VKTTVGISTRSQKASPKVPEDQGIKASTSCTKLWLHLSPERDRRLHFSRL